MASRMKGYDIEKWDDTKVGWNNCKLQMHLINRRLTRKAVRFLTENEINETVTQRWLRHWIYTNIETLEAYAGQPGGDVTLSSATLSESLAVVLPRNNSKAFLLVASYIMKVWGTVTVSCGLQVSHVLIIIAEDADKKSVSIGQITSTLIPTLEPKHLLSTWVADTQRTNQKWHRL